MDSLRELEEERRLFYVAITRTEELCYISFAKSRFKNGQVNFANPSRFIKDIDPKYLDQPAESPRKSRNSFFDEDEFGAGSMFGRKLFNQPKSYIPKPVPENSPSVPKRLKKIPVAETIIQPENLNPTIPVGKFVKHQLFGIGKVLSISMSGANEKAEIDFGEKGVKSLLIKFAKLETLE